MRKGQGRRPLLDARGLQALRRHCITHRHDSVIDITKWAQEYFQKPLSVNTLRHAICRCQLKLYHAKRKPYVNMVQKRHRVLWAKKWKSVLWSDESKFDILVGNHGQVNALLQQLIALVSVHAATADFSSCKSHESVCSGQTTGKRSSYNHFPHITSFSWWFISKSIFN